MRARWNRALRWFTSSKVVSLESRRILSGSNDSPGELPRGDEIRSIILYNNVSQTVRKLFDLHESKRRLVSCRRGCLCAHSRRVAVMFFSPVDKSAESCPIFSPAAKVSRQEDSCFTISRTFRARETNTSSGWMYRENDAYVNQYSSGYSGYLNVDGARVSLRDLKRRSITWIVNPPGR